MVSEKEKHLENVTLFLSKVRTTIIAKELASIDLQEIELWGEYVTKPNPGFKLNCSFFHKDGYLITPTTGENENKLVSKIRDLFSILDGYNASEISFELATKSFIKLDPNEDLYDRCFDLLLSKELKALFNCRELINELDSQKTSTTKKLKV
jgi:hypothetical protein